MWVILSFLSALSSTAKFIIGKVSTNKSDDVVAAFSMQFFAAIVLFPFVLYAGIPKLTTSYWISLLGLIVTIPTWSLLYIKALKLSPLSVSVPMLAFNPVFTAFLAIFFDKRLPDFFGWTGIAFVALGLYLSRVDEHLFKEGVLYPFRKIGKEKGALAMLGVGFIWSIGAYLSKINSIGSSPLFFAFSSTLIGSVILYILSMKKTMLNLGVLKKNITNLTLLGAANGIGELTFGAALSYGFTPYVVAVVRTSILWSSLAGWLFFSEKFTKIKAIGLLLMFSGVLFIIF